MLTLNKPQQLANVMYQSQPVIGMTSLLLVPTRTTTICKVNIKSGVSDPLRRILVPTGVTLDSMQRYDDASSHRRRAVDTEIQRQTV